MVYSWQEDASCARTAMRSSTASFQFKGVKWSQTELRQGWELGTRNLKLEAPVNLVKLHCPYFGDSRRRRSPRRLKSALVALNLFIS